MLPPTILDNLLIGFIDKSKLGPSDVFVEINRQEWNKYASTWAYKDGDKIFREILQVANEFNDVLGCWNCNDEFQKGLWYNSIWYSQHI